MERFGHTKAGLLRTRSPACISPLGLRAPRPVGQYHVTLKEVSVSPDQVGRTLGIIRHNLLMVFDNEKGWEFRSQCEVPIGDGGKAQEIVVLLANNTPDSLETAKGLVASSIHPKATELFKRCIADGFDENIANLEKQGGTPKR